MNLQSEQGTTVYHHINDEQTVLSILSSFYSKSLFQSRNQHKELRANFLIQV